MNENEARLFDDMREFFLSIAPPGEAYKHNDLHQSILLLETDGPRERRAAVQVIGIK